MREPAAYADVLREVLDKYGINRVRTRPTYFVSSKRLLLLLLLPRLPQEVEGIHILEDECCTISILMNHAITPTGSAT